MTTNQLLKTNQPTWACIHTQQHNSCHAAARDAVACVNTVLIVFQPHSTPKSPPIRYRLTGKQSIRYDHHISWEEPTSSLELGPTVHDVTTTVSWKGPSDYHQVSWKEPILNPTQHHPTLPTRQLKRFTQPCSAYTNSPPQCHIIPSETHRGILLS